MEAYQRRTGVRVTYARLAQRTGLSRATIESVATRPNYNASLRTIDAICNELGCSPGDLLEHRPDAAEQNEGKP